MKKQPKKIPVETRLAFLEKELLEQRAFNIAHCRAVTASHQFAKRVDFWACVNFAAVLVLIFILLSRIERLEAAVSELATG